MDIESFSRIWQRVRPDLPSTVPGPQSAESFPALLEARETLTALYRRLGQMSGDGALRALCRRGEALGDQALPGLRAELFLRRLDCPVGAEPPAAPGVLSALREAQRRETLWAQACRRAAAGPDAPGPWLETLACRSDELARRLRELLRRALR